MSKHAPKAESWPQVASQTPRHIIDKPFLSRTDRPPPSPYPDTFCVHALLQEQALRTPDAEALIACDARLTYRELAAQSHDLAKHLCALGIGPGQRVGLCIERNAAMIIALWAIIEAGAAYVPIDPRYPRERIAIMLEDAALPWLLTQRHIAPTLPSHATQCLCIEAPEEWPYPDTAPVHRAPTPDDLLYAMYTSGSTGRPKSAMIHHRGIVNLIHDMAKRPGLTHKDTAAAVISLSHDMSVADIFLTLSVGARLLLINTDDAADPRALAAQLAQERVSYISATPTTFRMLLALDWQPTLPMTLLMAGEALPQEIIAPLLARDCTIWNGYGMTEASVYSTMTQLTDPDATVTIGGRVANTPIYILDELQQPVSIGETGELYVGGVGVGLGYFDRPAMTAAKFLPDPFSQEPRATMYRSGDLARWRPDGDIECLGRIDQQVKIRGFRVEVEEIEARLNHHPEILHALVMPWEAAAGDKRLIAYLHTHTRAPAQLLSDLRRDLFEHLPAYMWPSRYHFLDAIPLTPAGKIDRKSLPIPTNNRPPDAPTPTLPHPDQWMQQTLCTLFETLCQVQPMGIDDNFFRFGGHSLLAAQLVARIRDQCQLTLPVHQIFAHPTPLELAQYIATIEAHHATTPPTGEQAPPTPGHTTNPSIVSDLQHSQWFIAQLNERHPEYHVNLIFRCSGESHHQTMEAALDGLIARHDILRTTYKAVTHEPLQCIHPHHPISLPQETLQASEYSDLYQAHTRAFFREPFDLEQGPVWRAQWLQLDHQMHHLLLCVHHIAIDGWSIKVIFEELCALYALASQSLESHAPKGLSTPTPAPEAHLSSNTTTLPTLPPLPLQYADYAHWQRQRLSKAAQAQDIAYWCQRLQGAPARIALPGAPSANATPTQSTSTDGTAHPLVISAALTEALRAVGAHTGTTLFMGLLTAFGAWIATETGQDDLPIGTILANRNHTPLEPLIGFLANTVVMRLQPRLDDTFQTLLAQTRAHTLDAFAHQDLPYGRVVSALQPKRSQDQQALFHTCFILQAPPTDACPLPGMSMDVLEVDNGAAAFDMTLQCWESGDQVIGNLLCRDQAIPPAQLPALITRFLQCLEVLVTTPTQALQLYRPAHLIAIEEALLAQPRIHDAHVVHRTNERLEIEIVAYIVGEIERIDPAALELALPPTQSLAMVPVAHIPLHDDGRVHIEALLALPTLDRHTLQSVHQVAPDARYIPWTPAAQQLHLDLLLPPDISLIQKAKETQANASPDRPSQTAFEPTIDVPVAILEGPPLRFPEDAPKDLPGALWQAAREHPTHGITSLLQDNQRKHCTYPALWEAASTIAAGLQRHGLQPGAPILLQCEDHIAFLQGLWACWLGGYVAVPLGTPQSFARESSASQILHNAWKLLKHPPILGTSTTIKGLHAFAAQHKLPFELLDVNKLQQTKEPMTPVTHAPEAVVVLLLTSGSTGVPKAVQQYHLSILAQAEGTRQYLSLSSKDIFLNWLPIEHVGGLLMTHITSVLTGAHQYHCFTYEILQQPTRWLDRLESTRATFTWAPNFAYALLNQQLQQNKQQWDLRALRYMVNGGEAIVDSTARRFVKECEGFGLQTTAMTPAWGMSEACSATVYQRNFAMHSRPTYAPYVSVGKPIPGFALRIADDKGDTLPEGTTGRFLIRGQSLMKGYLAAPHEKPIVLTPTEWFDTGDVGFVADGELYMTGRSKDEIIVNGINYPSHEIEAAVESLPCVEHSFTAACAIRQPDDETDSLAIFFVPTPSASNEIDASDEADEGRALLATLQQIRREVTKQIGISPALLLPLHKQDIPKTNIGKIQRSLLKRQYEDGAFVDISRRVDLCLQNHRTVPAWFFRRQWQQRMLPVQPQEAARAERWPATAWVFCYPDGPTSSLVSQLTSHGVACTRITPGDTWEIIGPDHIQIRPGSRQDASTLCQMAAPPPDWILHLWTCETTPAPQAPEQFELLAQFDHFEQFDQAQEMGLWSLQALLAAWEQAELGPAQQWLVASLQAQSIASQEPVAVKYAPLLGMITTVTHEHPTYPLRHIDLDEAALADPRLAYRLLQEFADRHRQQPEVALHKGQRWISRFSQVMWRAQPPTSDESLLPLPPGDHLMVLIGGLGGLGQHVAALLRARYGVDLLLVGRTQQGAWSPRQQAAWDTITQSPHPQSEQQRKPRVAYVAIDFDQTSPTAIEAIISDHERQWGAQWRGVFHLAAVLEEKILTRLVPDDWTAPSLAKCKSGWLFGQLLLQRQQAGHQMAYVDFGSINGFLGGYGVGMYAASARMGDSLTHELRRAKVKAYQLAWGRWDQLGMSQDRPGAELAAQRGYPPIPLRQGLSSMLACLAQPPGTFVIGLDGTNPMLRKYIANKHATSEPPRDLATTRLALPALIQLAALDRFGVPLTTSIALPSVQESERQTIVANVSPRDHTESQIAAIWKEVLGLSQIGIDHNFFDLGGHSLLLTQIQQRMEQTFAQEIPIISLFRYTTIRSLAAHLAPPTDSSPTPQGTQASPAQARGARQREKLAQTQRAVRKRRQKDG